VNITYEPERTVNVATDATVTVLSIVIKPLRVVSEGIPSRIRLSYPPLNNLPVPGGKKYENVRSPPPIAIVSFVETSFII